MADDLAFDVACDVDIATSGTSLTDFPHPDPRNGTL